MAGEGGTGGGGGGSSAGNGGTGNGGEPRGESRRGPRIRGRRQAYQPSSEAVESLIHKFGSRDRAIEALSGQTFDLREDLREVTDENDQLKAKVPPAGAVVLTGADVANWNAIKAGADELKLPADKLGEQLVARAKKAGTLEKAEEDRTTSEARKAVAAAANVDGDVLDPLLNQFGLDVELRDIQVQGNDGKLTPTKVAHVKKSGDANAAWEKLTDFIARDGSPLKPFATALQKKQATQQSTTAAPFPAQTSGGSSSGGTGSVDAFIAKRNEAANRPNPFSKPTPEKKAG